MIKTTWTEEQVASLRGYQACGYAHEFTGRGGAALIPTVDGWVEREGGPVVQDWAHDFMLDGSWERMQFTGSGSGNVGAFPFHHGMAVAAAPLQIGHVLPAQKPCPTCGKPMAIGWPVDVHARHGLIFGGSTTTGGVEAPPAWTHACSWCDDERTKDWRAALVTIASGECTAGWCCGKTCLRSNRQPRPELDGRVPCGVCRARMALNRKTEEELASRPCFDVAALCQRGNETHDEHEARVAAAVCEHGFAAVAAWLLAECRDEGIVRIGRATVIAAALRARGES